jgi:hypothetical protein
LSKPQRKRDESEESYRGRAQGFGQAFDRAATELVTSGQYQASTMRPSAKRSKW